MTLGTIIQSAATVLFGSVTGIAFVWKAGLVGVACIPLLVSAGYVRLVSPSLPKMNASTLTVFDRKWWC